MGYYTTFKLELKNHNGSAELDRVGTEYRLARASLEKMEMAHLLGEPHHTKWYGYEEDFKQVSKQAPSVLFVVSGEGEDSGDGGRHYFLNGKSQYCPAQITYADFDRNLLK